MIKKDVINGSTEKQAVKTEQDIKEINEKREPILNQLNTLKNTKADKSEVNDVLLIVTDMKSTLDNHCKDDSIKVDDKRWYQQRDIQVLLFIVGAIITLAIAFNH